MWKIFRGMVLEVEKRCKRLPGDVVQFAISELDAKILVAVSARFTLSAVADSILDGVGTTAMRAEDADSQVS
jgi:hypothetical protein